jgi:sarcosine oxidase delta subunit
VVQRNLKIQDREVAESSDVENEDRREGGFASELLDWIRETEKYLYYEDVDEEKKVKHVVTKLKGHAALWWDELRANRRSKGKQNIKSLDRMVAKLKAKFIPKDYHINLFRRLQNLRQKGMTVKEYTKYFYRLNIKARQKERERDEEKVSRYINILRYEIQDEINMMTVRKVENAYQIALKEEENLARNQS